LRDDHEDGVSERAVEQREIRTRRRLREGITDVTEIRQHLDSANRELVFGATANAKIDSRELRQGIRSMIRVAYMGLRESEMQADAERIVRHEMMMAEERLQLEESGELDELDQLVERYKYEDGTFTPKEVEKLLSAGALNYRGLDIQPNVAETTVRRDTDNTSE